MIRLRRITAINAVTATTTSNKFWVGGARRIGLIYRRANHGSGSTAFTAKGSLEPYELGNGAADAVGNKTGGTAITMTALNTLIDNVTNTNSQTLTRVNSKTLSADGDALLWVSPETMVNWLEITATETTDGTHSAWIVVEEDLPSTGSF